jgi:glycerol-3-phosphate acyltransferase PlsY
MPEPTLSLAYWPVLVLGSYLLGSIPFSQVVARLHGIDLRTVGSGNVGAGNLTKQVGKGWGAVAALADGLKGTFPVLIATNWAGWGPGAAGMVGLAAVMGHNWSIWMRGRSGRGLATSAGVLLGLDPLLLLWTTAWAVAGWKIGGGFAGFLGWTSLPLVTLALGRPPTESLFLLVLAAVLIARRIQGNPDSSWEFGAIWRRAVYDNDPAAFDFERTARDPLTP